MNFLKKEDPMKHSQNEHVLRILSRLPRNMMKMHGDENISEFVLHELCCKDCFNLSKAAYFVDNPAFNCLKGVAGFKQEEACQLQIPIWDEPSQFSAHMQSAPFNQKVRECVQYSCKNCENPDESIMQEIAKELEMDSFKYCTWDMKHDNHGYLIYQTCDQEPDLDDLISGLSLLSFCPIF